MNYEINRLMAEARMKEMRDYAYQNSLYVKRKKTKPIKKQTIHL